MADAAAPAPAPAPAATPAQASAEPALVLAGYLTKQGGAVKSWKKRYFTLKGTKLQYFKSAKDATELGVIDLSECDKLVESTVKPHGFEVHTPNRIFRVVADTNDDKEAWVLVIKPRIGTNRVSKDGDSSDEDEHEKFGEPMEIIQPPEGYADEARQSLSAAAVEPPAVAAVSAPADAATPAATSDAPSAVAEAPAAAPAEPVAKPTISGYLTKQGGAHKNWKRRYFALTGNELKYFKSEKDKKSSRLCRCVKEHSCASCGGQGIGSHHCHCHSIEDILVLRPLRHRLPGVAWCTPATCPRVSRRWRGE
eukprot:Opistho-2@27665